MGRRAWLPWVVAIATEIVVGAVGYPSWVSATAATFAFLGVDEQRHRSGVPSSPVIRTRREAWLFVASESLLVALGLGFLLWLIVGDAILIPWVGPVLMVGALTAIQFLNLIRHRENGDAIEKRSVSRARHEAWALVRGGAQRD